MMRKLVLLMLVLGIASVATAGLSITVGGADVGDSIAAAPATVDITATAENSEYYMLVAANADATLSGGAIVLGDMSMDMTAYLPYMLPYTGLDAAAHNGIAGFIGTSTGANVDGIAVDLVGLSGAGTIMLYTSEDSAVWTLTDTLTVVPEPMTVGLLGLGGLFLRRRK